MAGLSVYSTRFLSEAAASGDYPYEVPAGYTAVIRDVWVGVGVSLEAQGLTLYLPSGGRVLYLGSSEATPGFVSFGQEMRIVAYAGETFTASAFGTIDFYVGGYLLSTP